MGLITCLMATNAQAQEPRAVIDHYADLALAKYTDALNTAKELDASIQAFLGEPSEQNFDAAKEAWLVARVPYQQTEVYRFGNVYVDEWEGKVNAWPLDEGLIDYVATDFYGEESDENIFYTANIIANPELTVSGKTLEAGSIDADLIRSLHEVDTVEANVTTGYHAIEFLLWGQDLNYTGPGAGNRPWTDYADGEDCTNGNCDRRGDYLQAASDLLVADLEDIVAAWSEGGEARSSLDEASDNEGLAVILTGMGSLSYGEQAGERMQLGLLLHDPEEEHDCFSDNTHNSHFYDAKGIQNIYLGRYERPDGSVLEGPSLAALVQARDGALDGEMQAALEATMAAMNVIKETADSGEMAYDQMIGEGNAEGNAMVQAAIDGLIAQTAVIEQIVATLELEAIDFEGSDSLDDPEAVFQ
ncbi:MAG: imelysin family protein [Pseudomonadota bacterium]